ncbi:hypothetical protein [Alteromonas flava]|uniref:hypothetical protein n=1 Tax=Alteromonas flava TaxID=2048003 RepID=UPI000C290A61|nr:hypothetical protein [Alteromonas flava]
MKKLILILTLLTGEVTAQENLSFTCIQDNNNFIVLYPFMNKWAIITDKPIQAARRAEGAEAMNTKRVTPTAVTQAPAGTKKRIWAQGAVENNLVAYIEPLCFAL